MTDDELFEQAKEIAKPCVYLTTSPEDGCLAGVWGGEGILPTEQKHHHHWLSISCSILPEEFSDLKLSGFASVYSNEEECEGGLCLLGPDVNQIDNNGGKLLYAKQGISIPSFTVLLEYGTPKVKQWLKDISYDTSKPYYPHRELNEQSQSYTIRMQEDDPFMKPDGPEYAVLGGWSIEVYEYDWQEFFGFRQFLFTYKDSEPWIQVWVDKSCKFHICQRIT
jgi:hypothetical protein